MKKLHLFGIVALFTIYWATTIFFVMPDNYLKIKMLRAEKLFSTFFYQRWSFFAPPPTSNDRLYYEFVDKDTKKVTIVEVLKDIQVTRQKQFLFNDDISVLDYILSNTVNNIVDLNRDSFNIYKSKYCKNDKDESCYEEFLAKEGDIMYKGNEINTLRNYGLIILSKKGFNNIDRFRIVATQVQIPKFNDRFAKVDESKLESVIIKSKYYNLNEKKWEL
jgi:hypothetical protein